MPAILLLFLKAFISTGGIEKVNRTLLRILADWQEAGIAEVAAASPYSSYTEPRYFPDDKLHKYRGRRLLFLIDMLRNPWFKPIHNPQLLLCTHVNLAPAIWLLSWRFPHLRIILLTHGIEVWRPLKGFKRWLLHRADQIIAVSHYTANQLQHKHGIAVNRIHILPNCLDPFFEAPHTIQKPGYLLDRYGISPQQPVLLTVTRLNQYEAFKGYDKVLEIIPSLVQYYPNLKYFLCGKFDDSEKKRLDNLIDGLNIRDNVQLTGFLPETELIDHYQLANVFVMPSKKEGFGLVFIESMACGTPAIGGNQDGSPEALCPGELGIAVNPDDTNALMEAICKNLEQPYDTNLAKQLQAKTLERFDYGNYKNKLERLIFQ